MWNSFGCFHFFQYYKDMQLVVCHWMCVCVMEWHSTQSITQPCVLFCLAPAPGYLHALEQDKRLKAAVQMDLCYMGTIWATLLTHPHIMGISEQLIRDRMERKTQTKLLKHSYLELPIKRTEKQTNKQKSKQTIKGPGHLNRHLLRSGVYNNDHTNQETKKNYGQQTLSPRTNSIPHVGQLLYWLCFVYLLY